MSKIAKLMGSFPSFLLMLVFCAVPMHAATFFYVDPDWTGTQNGSATNPWTYLSSSAWTTIDSALASGTVTVYYSARQAGSDTDETSTTAIAINRTNGSTNRLTLDGMTKYNTNDSSPSWSDYNGNSKFRITAAYPIDSNNDNSPYPFRNYVTIRGFRVFATNGKTANLKNMSNLIFEYNDCSHVSGAGGGPGVSIGRPGTSTGSFASHIIIRNNVIHDTVGEGIYLGGSSPDPPGNGSVNTHDDVLIQANTVYDAGRYGGEGDGIDIKDGNTNVRIVGNHVYRTSAASSEVRGIVVQAASLIDGNFVVNYSGDGISTAGSWDNSFGKNGLVISNNMVIAATRAGIRLWGGLSPCCVWTNTKLYNNTIFNCGESGIYVTSQSGYVTNNISVQNNIVWNNGSTQFSAPAGVLAGHDYNDFFSASGGSVACYGSNCYTASSIGSFETHSKSVNPNVISTSTPYQAVNFKLQSSSACLGTGIAISTFVNDFFGSVRVLPWDIGAAMGGGSVVLAPPTGLRVVP